MKHDARRPRLRIEALEDRATPAVWNNPWPEPDRLTLSFAPDGTQYADGTPSSLFAALGRQMTTAEWQGEFLRAAQTWAAVAGVNVSVVPDSGKPFGQPGPLQGSKDFGDIRVGARPLADSSLIVTTPFDLLDNAAGDIVVNADKAFGRGGGGGAVDLYTAALQEVGHALGIPNSPDPASAMYTVYGAPRAGLSAGDVAGVRGIYGARTPDRFEGSGGNETAAKAYELTFAAAAPAAGADPAAGSKPVVAAGDVTAAGDVDFYKVKLPSGQRDFFVELRTSGVSSLVGRVSVYASNGVLVKSAAAADPMTGDLSVFVSGAVGATYTVKVEGAGAAGFNTGAYRLSAGQAAHAALFPALAGGLVNPDGGSNDTLATAKAAGKVKLEGGDRWEWTTRASIEGAADRDFYSFETDKDYTGGTVVLSAWALEADALDPVIRVYDMDGRPLPVDVLSSDRSTYTVQVVGIAKGAKYAVEVAAADPTAAGRNTGSYFLGADLRAAPVVLTAAASGTLTDAARQWAGQFTVELPRTFHFNLTLGTAPAAVGAAARVTVYDAAGQVVASFVTRAGDTVGTDVPLGVGTYTVKVSAGTQSGAALPNLGYALRMLVRDDPIGPGASDPTAAPVAPPTNPPPPPVVLAPTTRSYWVDAYSDPWFGV